MPSPKAPLTVEFTLIGLLRRRPLHGYELHQLICASAELSSVWRIKQSLLYIMLNRLEEEGYLTATVTAQGARPPRRLLHTTPAGEQAYLAWLQAPVPSPREIRLEFMLKLYCARLEGAAAVQALVQRQQNLIAGTADSMRGRLAALPPAAEYERLVLGYRLGQLQAALAWLAACAPETAQQPTQPATRPSTLPA